MNSKIAVVAIGYNRPHCMDRLLNSIIKAVYSEPVDLIISLDKGERQSEIVELAEHIEWDHGKKIVRVFPKRQGLKAHVLACGDLTDEYDAVIVFEDDIVVSKYFFDYAIQSIRRYGDDARIGGISLYSFKMNPYISCSFQAANNGFDTYMMQIAQSWGQCWTKRMWQDFKAWYVNNSGVMSLSENIPECVVAWDSKSWLKYFDKFVVETNRFFIYPYISLSTNCSDVGEHAKVSNSVYQVELLERSKNYNYPSFEDSIKYDAFFERIFKDGQLLPYIKGKKVLDLYGSRRSYADADYLISTRVLPYKIVQEIQLMWRPQEINCTNPKDGKGIYVYDLHNHAKKVKSKPLVQFKYWHGLLSCKKLMVFTVLSIYERIKDKLNLK